MTENGETRDGKGTKRRNKEKERVNGETRDGKGTKRKKELLLTS